MLLAVVSRRNEHDVVVLCPRKGAINHEEGTEVAPSVLEGGGRNEGLAHVVPDFVGSYGSPGIDLTDV